MYASDQSIERSRLEGHMIEVPSVYEITLPWRKRGVGGALDVVRVRSSVPARPHIVALHPSAVGSGNNSRSRFDEFSRAVRSRMLQDLRLLPLDDPETLTVQRHNVTEYASPSTSEVLIVYSPTLNAAARGDDEALPPQRLEFVSFTLLPPVHHP
jgi:hypothetical protein